jgi:predicted glycoside hydrolase/deacetylase ChbG (UPF0249 family)
LKLLIINADDLGYDPEVTRGILESMRQGVVSSTTFMVNTPHSEAAARLAHGLSVGLHLNLARYAPVSKTFPQALLDKGELAEAHAASLPAQAVRLEVLAQLDRLEALLARRATHIDVHKHLHRHEGVLTGLMQAAKERGLPVRSLDGAMRERLRAEGISTPDHFVGEAGSTAYWTADRLAQSLPSQDGVTEWMCHPGYRPSTLKSGYSEQREVELEAFTSGTARALLDRAGIHPVSFSALPRSP